MTALHILFHSIYTVKKSMALLTFTHLQVDYSDELNNCVKLNIWKRNVYIEVLCCFHV